MKGYWIKLTKEEFLIGTMIGSYRNMRANKNNKKDAHGFEDDGWEAHIEGACAEIAAYKLLGVFWSPSIDKQKEPGGDGGYYEVRRRSKQDYDHLIRTDDAAARIHIMVVGEAPSFRVVGWIWGHEARQDRWWKNHGNRGWAWFVPQGALHDMSELR